MDVAAEDSAEERGGESGENFFAEVAEGEGGDGFVVGGGGGFEFGGAGGFGGVGGFGGGGEERGVRSRAARSVGTMRRMLSGMGSGARCF